MSERTLKEKEKVYTPVTEAKYLNFLIEDNFLSYERFVSNFNNYLEEIVSYGLIKWFEFYKNNHENQYKEISKIIKLYQPNYIVSKIKKTNQKKNNSPHHTPLQLK
mgnify:CR=1 FL=1